jgi:flagellar hook-length control protein FliK
MTMAGMNTGNISGAVRIEPVAVTGGPADIVSAMNESFDEHLQRARHETADRPAAPEESRDSDTPPDPPKATTDGPETAGTDRQDPVQSESDATASESSDTAEADEQSDGEEKTDTEATGAEAAAVSASAESIPDDPSQTPIEPEAANEPSADPSKTPTGIATEEGPEGSTANSRQADPTQTTPAGKANQVVVESSEANRDVQATPDADPSAQPNNPKAAEAVSVVAAEPETAASKRPQRSTDPKRSDSDRADARSDASKTSGAPVAGVPTGAETTTAAAPAGAVDAASLDSETGASAPKPAPLGVNPVDPGVSDRVGSPGEPPSGTTGPGRPGAGLDQVDRVRFVQRVARAFESLGARGGTIRMRLHPPELGSLQLDITVRNGVMTARLETDSAAARNLLLDNLPALRDRLAQQDIKVERFDVDLADGSSGGSPERPDDRPQRDDHPDRRGSPEAGDADSEGSSSPRVVTRAGEGTYVNVVV